MSFRIEDILKRDEKRYEKATRFGDEIKTSKPVYNNNLSTNGNTNLLHQILEKNVQAPYYYRTMGDNQNMLVSPNFQYSNYYCFSYFDNGLSNIRARSESWPRLASNPPSIYPLQLAYFSKRKGGQVRFTAVQTDILENRFNAHKYLSPEERKRLAESLNLADRQVKTWFQNRRAKWRRNNHSTTETSSSETTSQASAAELSTLQQEY